MFSPFFESFFGGTWIEAAGKTAVALTLALGQH
jgi:hypothetical protein